MYLIENHHEASSAARSTTRCRRRWRGAGRQKALQESGHRSCRLHQPLRPLGSAGVRRVRNAVPPLHMDAPRWKARRVALCEPPGLRQEILPQLAHAGRGTAPAGDHSRLNTVLPDLDGRIHQITEALEAEVIPFPGSGMSLATSTAGWRSWRCSSKSCWKRRRMIHRLWGSVQGDTGRADRAQGAAGLHPCRE